MTNIEHQIRVLQAYSFEPYEPDTEYTHPGLIILCLSIIAWAAVGMSGYAVYRAALAVWG